ncbi:MAG: Uma2 family endonuclease, partial [Gemmatimonadaceae bacterium]
AEDVLALPDDGKRHEVIDGELFVTPAPTTRHHRLVREFYRSLMDYLRDHPIGEVLASPADIELAADTLVQPDLFVFPLGSELVQSWKEIGRLMLAIEVLSPSTARTDRTVKRLRYQRAGIPEYWIVDADARLVERWRPQDERPDILTARLEWCPDPSRPPLVIALPELFGSLRGRFEL